MQMTEQQFDEAIEQLEQAGLAGVDGTEPVSRVFAVSCFVMRQQLRLSDNKSWSGPTSAELTEFLTSISDVQRKRLKQIADALIEQGETLY